MNPKCFDAELSQLDDSERIIILRYLIDKCKEDELSVSLNELKKEFQKLEHDEEKHEVVALKQQILLLKRTIEIESDDVSDKKSINEYKEFLKFKEKYKDFNFNIFWEYEIQESMKESLQVPDGVTNLFLNRFSYCELSNFIIPETVTIIVSGRVQNIHIKKSSLPSKLECLSLDGCHWVSIEEYAFPETLEYLSIGEIFEREFKKDELPKNLKGLCVSPKYSIPFRKGILPKSLETLTIPEGIKNDSVIPEGCKVTTYNPRFH